MILPSQRDLFDIPADVTYLNCAYMSPLLRTTLEAGVAAIARKARPWQITADDFFRDSDTARGLFAELIGADADGVAVIPSVSYGMAVASANLPVRPGARIVVLADEFPSNYYPWRTLAQHADATVVTVPRPEDDDWTTAVLAQIDERAEIVAVPNCHWTDGSLVDLVRIGEQARTVGVALVVDATQSLGAYPLDVGAVRPDFLVAAGYKWLLGPYSLGFLYVDQRYRQGTPVEYGWLSRAGSEDFRGLVDYTDAFQPGARRFDVGEHSNFILMPMIVAALRQLLTWGVPAIAETLAVLTDAVEARAAALGLPSVPAERRAPHLMGIRLPRSDATLLAERLAAAKVYVSVRGQSMRVSPHLYNTLEDVDRLFAVLEGTR
jgi:selenocysteine lyase/cysteine desulfurase